MNNILLKYLKNPNKYINNFNFKIDLINILIDENKKMEDKMTFEQKELINKKLENVNIMKKKKKNVYDFSNILKKNENNIDIELLYLNLRYIYTLKILNLINDNYYLYTLNKLNIEKKESKSLLEFELNIIKEESDTNFGHTNIIWKGNVSFPKREKIDINSSNYHSSNYNSSNYNSTNQEKIYEVYDKQLNILQSNLTPINDLLKIYRYGFKKLNKPNDDNGPTLSVSLFIPNNINSNYGVWVNKYLINQLILAVVFTYYFPEGNYRNYFDFYMFKKFELIPDSDDFNITKSINEFIYLDFETKQNNIIKNILNSYYIEIKKYETFKFNNSLERLLCYFDIACRTYINSRGEYSLRNKTGDFFVYKLDGPFLEQSGGHVTNGYIGQLIRFISLKQTNYNYEGIIIKRPTYILTRDAHASNIGYNDTEWINKYMITGDNYYVIGHSKRYMSLHHDYMKCSNTDYYLHKSFWAGYTNFINKTNSKSIIEDNEWINTIGIGFILNLQNLIQVGDFSYGIDEYILTNLLIHRESKIKLVLFNLEHLYAYFDAKNYPKLFLLTRILLSYLVENNYVLNSISKYDFIREIEKIRNGSYTVLESDYNDINLLLSLIPNKYSSFNTISYNIENIILNDLININDYIKNDIYSIKYKGELDKYDITCKNNLLVSPFEWCMDSYNESKDKINCPPANFYSGFYYEQPPSLNIGILRQPADLDITLEALKNNKLKNKLNISDYKVKVERDIFSKDVLKNIDDNICHIKPTLQTIILNYGEIDDNFGIAKAWGIANRISAINPQGTSVTQSYVWVPLIWRALNYFGYDVNPKCLEVKLDTNDNYRIFNEAVKELANIPGWAEYAVRILVGDNDNYNKEDNDIDSEKVKNKSSYYANLFSIDHSQYMMDKYKKYLKYKQKYLKLKHLLNKVD